MFLKAAIPGGAHRDLFAVSVPVAGHTKAAGTYVAPYQAMRLKAPEPAERVVQSPARRQLDATRAGINEALGNVAQRCQAIERAAEGYARSREPGRGKWFGRGATTWSVRQEGWYQDKLRELAPAEAANVRAVLARVERSTAQQAAMAARLGVNEPWRPGHHGAGAWLLTLLDTGQGPVRPSGGAGMAAAAAPRVATVPEPPIVLVQKAKPFFRQAAVFVDPAIAKVMPGLMQTLAGLLPRVAPGAEMTVLPMPAENTRDNGTILHCGMGRFVMHLAVDRERSQESLFRTLLHELGHMVSDTSLAAAHPDVRAAVVAQWGRETRQTSLTQAMVRSMAEGNSPETIKKQIYEAKSRTPAWEQWFRYPEQFAEWQAEKAATWMLVNERPRDTLDGYFFGIASKLRFIYREIAKLLGFTSPTGALEEHMAAAWTNPDDYLAKPGEPDWWRHGETEWHRDP